MEKERFFETRKELTLAFFQCWQLHQRMMQASAEEEWEENDPATDYTASVTPVEHASVDAKLASGQNRLGPLYPNDGMWKFDANLAPGQIRLLSQPERLTYVALLRRWEEDSFVVMPFSHFSEPATDEELKLEFDRGMHVRVLQAWNVRTLQDETLRESWLVDMLTPTEAEQAWQLWTASIVGKELPDEILQRTGLPIYRDNDPRLDYKREELDNFAQIDAEDLAQAEKPTWIPLPQPKPLPTGKTRIGAAACRTAGFFQVSAFGGIVGKSVRLAAGDEQPNPQYEFVTELDGKPLTIAVEYSQHDKKLSFRVYDETGNSCDMLDGYQVWDKHSGHSLGELRKGRLKVAYQWSTDSAVAFVSPDGESLAGEIKSRK